MPDVRVLHRLCLALLAICLLAPSVSADDPPINTVAEPLSAENKRDFELYRQILTGQTYPLNLRRTAAIRLFQHGWPEGINSVLRALGNDEDSLGQLAVAEALAETLPDLDRLPDRFVDPLIAALSAEDENLRQAAASALANYKLNVLDKLREILLQSDPATGEAARLAVVAAIERIKDKKSAQILIAALDDENPQLSARCRQGLERLTGIRPGDSNAAWQQWWQQYKDKNLAELRELFIAALMDRDRESQNTIKQLRDQLQSQIEVRWDTAQDKAQLLEKFLNNPLQDVRLQALFLAKRDLDPGAFPEDLRVNIRKLLTDPSPPVRVLAADVLRDLRDKQSAKIILEQLPKETDPGVRASFADALGYIGGAGAVQPLIKLLADPDSLVVGKAASALGNLMASAEDVGSQKSSVVQALRDRYQKTIPNNGADARLRSDILSAMGEVGSSSFHQLFLLALNDKSAPSRIAALEGLRTTPPNNSRKETLDAIRLLLDDPYRGVRLEVLTTLEYLTDLGALEALGKRLDPNVEPDADMQDAVWRVITSLLTKADLGTINDWERKTVVFDVPERHEQVLGILEAKLVEARTTPVRLIEVREKLGDYRESLKGWEAAASKYRLAYDQAKTISDQSISHIRDRLALKLLKALLNQGDFDQAVEHLSSIASVQEEALELTLDHLQSSLEPPIASKNIDAAIELISVLEKAHLSALSRSPLSKRLGQIKADALKLRQDLGTPHD